MNLNINKAALSGNLGLKDWNKNMLVSYNLQVDQPASLANLFALQLPVSISSLLLKSLFIT